MLEQLEFWQDRLNKQLIEIKSNKSYLHKLILILCLMDSYVQKVVGLNGSGEEKRFVEFFERFSNDKQLLEYDIVNLVYFVDDKVCKEELFNIIPEVQVSEVDKIINKKERCVLLEKIKIVKTKKELKKFRYLNLLYKFRCKLVHEFATPNYFNSIDWKYGIERPYYKIMSKIENKQLKKDGIQLVYPIEYIEKLLVESNYNYLIHCENEGIKEPYETKIYNHWYEKNR